MIAMARSHLGHDREIRENSACLKQCVLFYKDEKTGKFPAWTMRGAAEYEEWLGQVRDRQGEDCGSPHIKVGSIILQELMKLPEVEGNAALNAHKEILIQWWKNKVNPPGIKEQEVAAEIKVFKIGTPPPDDSMQDVEGEEMVRDLPKPTRGTIKPFIKLTFHLADPQANHALLNIMKTVGGEVKNGPAPRPKATKEVAQLLQKMTGGRGRR